MQSKKNVRYQMRSNNTIRRIYNRANWEVVLGSKGNFTPEIACVIKLYGLHSNIYEYTYIRNSTSALIIPEKECPLLKKIEMVKTVPEIKGRRSKRDVFWDFFVRGG